MDNTDKRVFLLDAMALIFRAYYALISSPRITSKGRNTNAQFGFTNALVDLINNQHPSHMAAGSLEARWAAARAADGPAMVPSLAQALVLESDARVREAIFTALARIATQESALAVLPYLRVDDANIRAGALDALRAMPDAARPQLRPLLADEDPDVRLLACDLARQIAGRDGANALCALLETESQANVCAAAVEALAEIGDAQALAALSHCAARFPDDPFLAFAIKIAAERLRSAPSAPRG